MVLGTPIPLHLDCIGFCSPQWPLPFQVYSLPPRNLLSIWVQLQSLEASFFCLIQPLLPLVPADPELFLLLVCYRHSPGQDSHLSPCVPGYLLSDLSFRNVLVYTSAWREVLTLRPSFHSLIHQIFAEGSVYARKHARFWGQSSEQNQQKHARSQSLLFDGVLGPNTCYSKKEPGEGNLESGDKVAVSEICCEHWITKYWATAPKGEIGLGSYEP